MSAGPPPPVSPLRAEHGKNIAKQIEDINAAIERAKGIRNLLPEGEADDARCALSSLIADLATVRASSYKLQTDVGALVLTGQAEWNPKPDNKRLAANDHD